MNRSKNPSDDVAPHRSTASDRWWEVVTFPEAYTWFVFVSALDFMFTWIVLHLRGSEVNPIANLVLERGGLWGLLLFKFTMVAVVVLLCEIIGRRRFRIGRLVAILAVVLTCLPVILTVLQLWQHVH